MMLETKEPKHAFQSNSNRLRKLTNAMQKIEQLSNIYNPDVKVRKVKKSGKFSPPGYLQHDRLILRSTSDLSKPTPPMLKTYDKLNKLKSLKKKKVDISHATDVHALYRGDSLLYRRQPSNLSRDDRTHSGISRNIQNDLDKAMQPLKAIRSKTKDLQSPFHYIDKSTNGIVPAYLPENSLLSKTFVIDTNNNTNDNLLNLSFCREISQQESFPPAATVIDMTKRQELNNILPKPTYTNFSPRGNGLKVEKVKTSPKNKPVKRLSTYVKTVQFDTNASAPNTNRSTNVLPLFDSYYSFQGDMFDFSSKYSDISSPLRVDDFMTRPNTVVFSVDETTSEVSDKTSSEDHKLATIKRGVDKKPAKIRKFKKIENKFADVNLEAVGQSVVCVNENGKVGDQVDNDKYDTATVLKDENAGVDEILDDALPVEDTVTKPDISKVSPPPPLVNRVEIVPDFPEPQKSEIVVKVAGIEKERHIGKTTKQNMQCKSLSDVEDNVVNQIDRRKIILARTNKKHNNDDNDKIMFTVSQYKDGSSKQFKDQTAVKVKKSNRDQDTVKSCPKRISLKEKTPMLVFFNHANHEAMESLQTNENSAKTRHYKVVSDFTHSQYLQNIGKPVLNKSLTDISDKMSRNPSSFDPLSHVPAPADESDASVTGAWRQQRKRENPLSLSEKLNRLNHYANKNKIHGIKSVVANRQANMETIQKNQEKMKKDQDNFVMFVQTEFGGSNPPQKTINNRMIIPDKLSIKKRQKAPYPPARPDRQDKVLQTNLLNLMPEVAQKIPQGNNAVNEHPGIHFASDGPHFRRATIPPRQSNTLESVKNFSFDPRLNMANIERSISTSPVVYENNDQTSTSSDSAAILPDNNRPSTFRLKHDVSSFDEGSRFRNHQTADNYTFPQNELKTNGNKSSPNNSRMDSRRHLCSMPSPAHVSFKETMPLSLIRMEDRLNEIPLAAASSPVTPTSGSTGMVSFMGPTNQKQGLGSPAPTNGGTITTFRLHKGKSNWNCKLGELSINGGGFYGPSNVRDSTSYASVPTSSATNQIQKNSYRERNSVTLKSQMSSRYGKTEDTKTKDKEAIYQDPCIGAAPSYQQRLMDLSMLESETVKYERNRRLRRKKNQDKDS